MIEKTILMSHIEGQTAWNSETFSKHKSFLNVYDFIPCLSDGLCSEKVIKSEPFKNMASLIVDICEQGQGVVVLQGLGSVNHTSNELLFFYKHLTSLMGSLASQNRSGEKIVSVSNKRSGHLSDKNIRAYNTDQGLSFHSDSSDITGLLCIHNSQEGGESRVVSAANIHNLILSKHKELLSIYYHGFIYDARGDEIQGSPPAYRNSVFHYADNKLSCRFYLTDYIIPGLEKLGLSASEMENLALNVFAKFCTDPANYISFKMASNDIVFYSNNTVLHSRQPFTSHTNSDTDRLLYRTWINPYKHRAFPKDFAKYRFGYDNASSNAMEG